MATMIKKVDVLHILYILLFLQCASSQSAPQEANSTIPVRCIERERQALLMFKQGVEDQAGLLSSWVSEGNTRDCCEWYGVDCRDVTGHVTSLDLSNNKLSGVIPYQLGNLSKLTFLDLSRNNFSGVIPYQLGNLSKLTLLELSDNNLSGVIPYQLGNLSKLTFLALFRNNDLVMKDLEWLSHLSSLTNLYLSGINLSRAKGWIDHIITSHPLLSVLYLSHCNLPGTMAPSLSSANSSSSDQLSISSDQLRYLDLSHNQLTGTIPAFRDCPYLFSLDLSYNQFTAFLPNTFGHVPNLQLQYLFISKNSLEVVITKEHLSNLFKLYYLDLSFNNISFNLSPRHVSRLQLNSLFLSSCKLGPRFPYWIKTQKILDYLDLSHNEISDSIPSWFWNLKIQHYLDLSYNKIIGTLPDVNFGVLGIDLSSNNLQGPIPNFLANGSRVDISRNNFSGTLSFLQAPKKIDALNEKLIFLDVSHNHLSAEIPDIWMNFKGMESLKLAHNNFTGKVPSSLGFLTKLQVLDLQSNKLSGELPVLLKNCTSLSFLNLGVNKFSGSIPAWMGDISKLYYLIMRSNEFSGSIPLQLCQLRNLHLLDLSRNDIFGEVPRCFNNFTGMAQRPGTQSAQDVAKHEVYTGYLGIFHDYYDNAPVVWKGMEREFEKNLEYMRSIDLSSNKLNGELPKTIFALVELVALNMSNNYLKGNIPSEVGDLKFLESLDLSKNRFSGGIPASMSNITSLSYLDLSNNNLSGKIPEGTQLQRCNASTYAGNYALCGAPLEKKCLENERPSQVPFIPIKDDEFDQWFYVAAALGFSTTFWGICGALFLNRRWRHAYFLYLNSLKDWVYVAVNVFIAKIRRT